MSTPVEDRKKALDGIDEEEEGSRYYWQLMPR
jgi:hypothetical protein